MGWAARDGRRAGPPKVADGLDRRGACRGDRVPGGPGAGRLALEEPAEQVELAGVLQRGTDRHHPGASG
ncbi:hypothetical protein GCM10022225_25680 [Plantactinospora mayteni]|uniref:Uncharacterized protein n=1 Tax=Plantactinospora mayteni TaxID=566021 RepID=A0ABQ4EIY2_9ACTN|nr:hypothetical protein Pma05_12750 [Plantactinospora mayteni]